jgi:hypothetical protein
MPPFDGVSVPTGQLEAPESLRTGSAAIGRASACCDEPR